VTATVGSSKHFYAEFDILPNMTTWAVIFTAEAEQEFNALPMDMRAHGAWIIELLESQGPHQVREPYVKPVEGKLWEMRLKGRAGIARALYFAQVGRRLCVVRVFVKKTEKTPRREIELALRRLAKVEDNEDV
jgi:phage-related protein